MTNLPSQSRWKASGTEAKIGDRILKQTLAEDILGCLGNPLCNCSNELEKNSLIRIMLNVIISGDPVGGLSIWEELPSVGISQISTQR